jgi:hypothetical protein
MVSDSIKNIFKGVKLEVVIMIRRQDDFIESCYLQQFKECRSISFDEFLEPIKLDGIGWEPLLERINSCGFIPLEVLKFNSCKSFLELFLSTILDKYVSVDSFEVLEKSNSSMSQLGVETYLNLLHNITQKHKYEINKIF